jgi:L-asparaginase
MNGELHAARYVVKSHTTALDAFSSGDHSPVGRIHEGRVRMMGGPLERLGHRGALSAGPWPKVALAKIGIGQDPDLLLALPSFGYRGCVLEAMGGGHVPARLVPAIEQLIELMPVILCSRAARGRVCEDTYGYPGSERDLLSRGVLSGGGLTGLKARVALTIMLKGCAEATCAFTRIAEAL